MNQQSVKQQNLNEEEMEHLKQIVLARLNIMPEDVRVSVGSKDLSKEQLIKHVESEDETGTQMMQMDLEFLQDLATGAIYKNE